MEEKPSPEEAGQPAGTDITPAVEPGPVSTPAKASLQADTLRLLADLAGESASADIVDFLSGRGSLVDTTRAALAGGKKTAVKQLAELLEKQFKMSPAAASVVAGLLVKLFPSISKVTRAVEPAKKKTKSKAKPKSKPKSKPKTKTKAETSATKPKTSKKTAAKKKPAATRKTTTRKTRK